MDIEIQNLTVEDYHEAGATAYLRFYSDSDWTDSDGHFHPQGSVGSGHFFREVELTVDQTAHTASVGAFSMTTTTDAQINNDVSFIAYLYPKAKGGGRGVLISERLRISTVYAPAVQWSTLLLASTVPRFRPPDPIFPTMETVRTLISQEVIPFGSLSVPGKVTTTTNTSQVVSTDDSRLLASGLTTATIKALTSTGLKGFRRATDGAKDVWADNGVNLFSLSGEIFDVKAFGAKGNGTTDDTAAIQAAIAAATITGGSVRFPKGSYQTSSTLIITEASGVHLFGAGTGATFIVPTPDLANEPVIILTNVRDSSISHMTFTGQSAAPPRCAIESRRTSIAGTTPTGNHFYNLRIGSDAGEFTDGIRFTCKSLTEDANNDHHIIENLKCYYVVGAAVSFEHSNSLLNQIIGGRFEGCAIGVQFTGGSSYGGGSAQLWGTAFIGNTDVDIAFESGIARHAVELFGCHGEDSANWLRVTSSVVVSPGTGEGPCFQYSNCDFQGTVAGDAVDFAPAGNGFLSFSDSRLLVLAAAGIRVRNCRVNFNNNLTDLHTIDIDSTARIVGRDNIAYYINSSEFQGVRTRKVTNVSATYQVTTSDELIVATGTFTITLPTLVANLQTGDTYSFVCVSGTVTIALVAGQNFDNLVITETLTAGQKLTVTYGGLGIWWTSQTI